MVRSFLVVSWRSIKGSLGTSLISFLSVFLSSILAITIFSYCNHQKSFDNFIPKKESKYRLTFSIYGQQGRNIHAASAPAPFGPFFAENSPEITGYVRFYNQTNVLISSPNLTSIKSNSVALADNGLLAFFGIPMVHGSSEITDPNSILLSRSLAMSIFGTDEAINESIRFNGTRSFVVSGIYEDFPKSSSIGPEALINIDFLQETIPLYYRNGENWGGYSFYTYFQLAENVSKSELLPKIQKQYFQRFDIDPTKLPEEYVSVDLINVADIHLHSDMDREIRPVSSAGKIRLLEVLSVVILLVGWINFMNIQAARAPERLKEVDVRKVLGASRLGISLMFLFEFLLLNIFAFSISYSVWKPLVVPNLDMFLDIQMSSVFLDHKNLMVFVTGQILASLYPAMVIVKSNYFHKRASFSSAKTSSKFRDSLIMIQLSASLFLITYTVISLMQVEHLKGLNPGINTSQLLVINGPLSESSNDIQKAELLRQGLLSVSGVEEATFATLAPGVNRGWTGNLPSYDGPNSTFQAVNLANINAEFFDVMGVDLLSGRMPRDRKRGDLPRIILNESAIKGFNWTPEEAIGKKLGYTDTAIVSAVVADFQTVGLQEAQASMAFIYDHFYQRSSTNDYFTIKMNGSDFASLISEVEEEFRAIYPEDSFEYALSDSLFEQQYEADAEYMRLFAVFSLCCILLAITGLIGSVTFILLRRNKEIGIRKVLGAEAWNILLLFYRKYFSLLSIAALIALPLVYFYSQNWLEGYANQISVGFIHLLIPFLGLALLFTFTVTIMTKKSTDKNPAALLKD